MRHVVMAASVALSVVLGAGVANAAPVGGGEGDPPPDDCVASTTGQVTVTPAGVTVGQSVTVHWSVDQLPGCTVWKRIDGLGFGGGNLAASGSRTVVLNNEGTADWTLTVSGSLGNTYTLDSATAHIAPQAGPPQVSSGAALTIVSSEAPEHQRAPGMWEDVPGLSTAVSAQAGSTLAATLSVQVFTEQTVWFRVLVDGAASAPTDVVYKFDGAEYDGTRSFTFGKEGLSAGRHIVKVQWLANAGSLTTIDKRTLSVNVDSGGAGASRLYHAATESGWLSKNTGTWESIPDLTRSLVTSDTRDLEITFSGLTDVGTGGFFARAVVDGQPSEDVLFAGAGVPAGALSYDFVRKALGAGTHTVAIQWFANNGVVKLADRAMTIFATPASAADGGMTASVYQGGPDAITDGPFTALSNIGGTFTTYSGGTNVEATVGLQLYATDHTLLRVLLDGRPMDSSSVDLSAGIGQYRAQSYTFAAKNVPPGTHTVVVQIQALQSTTYVSDRTLAVTFTKRPGSDFAQPYYGMSPQTGSAPPVFVVCFDTGRPDQVAPPSLDSLRAFHEGADGGRNVKGWFQENSAGQFTFSTPTYVGCADGNWLPAPAGRTGTWYWDIGTQAMMVKDALSAADPWIDFPSLDRDGNHYLSRDEAVIEVVHPQFTPQGEFRTVTAAVDGENLAVPVVDVYLNGRTDDFARMLNVAAVVHAAAHVVLGAADLYSAAQATRAFRWSVMDDINGSPHIDAFHKLKNGFVTPGVVETNKWTTSTITLKAVETSHEVTIIYDPARGNKEYFILENRWSGSGAAENYDWLNAPGAVLVWHIVEDLALQDQFPPPGGENIPSGAWGPKGVRLVSVLKMKGRAFSLKWADGSSAGLMVTLKSDPQEAAQVEIATL
ncbi:hypothetical protein J5X84_21645 [Streptosporangiaceae bacterium NEAU-GS5]|nr:hypothetical protein [Streptosporangiaceae bacterium NEAU-GS5]